MPKVMRLLAVVAVLALVGAACAEEGGGGEGGGAAPFPSSPPAAEDAGPLRLLEWAGYEIPEFHGPFSEAYPDVKLEYQFADAGSSFYQKVATGGVEVDLAHPCSNWVKTWYDAGLIAPIDVSRLEHWDELDPKMRELGKIGDQYYFVPWDWGYESLIVNTDMVKDVPQSWADLWDPQYEGLIAMEDFSEGAVAMTAWAFGLPYPNLSDEDLQFIKDKLIELKQNIKLFWAGSTDLVQAMVNGDVAIGYGWNDQFAKVVDGGVNAVYVDPKEGRGGWVRVRGPEGHPPLRPRAEVHRQRDLGRGRQERDRHVLPRSLQHEVGRARRPEDGRDARAARHRRPGQDELRGAAHGRAAGHVQPDLVGGARGLGGGRSEEPGRWRTPAASRGAGGSG